MIYKKEVYTEIYVQYNEEADVDEVINYTEVIIYLFGIKVAESVIILTQEIEEDVKLEQDTKAIGFKKHG